MSVFLLLGLVYLISDSGLQKNPIGKPGIQESRKGIAEIEGKATRVGSERVRGTSEFQLLLTAFRIAHDLSLKEQRLSKAPAGENSDWQGDNH